MTRVLMIHNFVLIEYKMMTDKYLTDVFLFTPRLHVFRKAHCTARHISKPILERDFTGREDYHVMNDPKQSFGKLWGFSQYQSHLLFIF